MLTKKATYDDEQDKKQGFDPNAIVAKLPELVRMVHGSLESKPKLIDDFNEAHPDCSKNSIERKFKECFVKDKRDRDPKQRYYATPEVLETLDECFPGGVANQELVDLAEARIQPVLEEMRL